MLRRQGDWLTARVGDELVMMSAEAGKYVGLDEIGSRIWELLESPQPFDALCAQLEQEFDVDRETCRAEVRNFLDELVRHGAVKIDPPSAA